MKKLLGLPAPVIAGVASLAAAMVTAGPAVPAAGTAAAGAAAPPTIMLINGERLAITAGPGAARIVTPLPGSPAGPLLSLSLGGVAYEIPGDALAYLGHGLDPSLFAVSALLRAEKDGRLPVRVSYRGRAPALPGVTITTAAHGVASGYLTESSAAGFGGALARQLREGRGGARPGAGLFRDGLSLSLAGAATAPGRPARRPRASAHQAALRTLTVRGTTLAGQPDNGDLAGAFNVDNSALSSNPAKTFAAFKNGVATFHVPAGHYLVAGFFIDTSGKHTTGFREPVLPQVTVSGDTTVRLDERTATSEVTMVTPRPAVVSGTDFDVHRIPARGAPIILNQGLSSVPTWVRPTSTPPTVGRLQTVTSQFLTAPKRARTLYWYDLSYQNNSGVIPGQRFVIKPSGLATVQRRYYSAAPLEVAVQQAGLYPTQFEKGEFVQANLLRTRLPAVATVYLTANPALAWTDLLTRVAHVSQPFPGLGFFTEQIAIRRYPPGRHAENWNSYPLHTAPDVRLPSDEAAVLRIASATRAGNVLTMLVTPFSDSTAGHLGAGFGIPDLPIGREPGVKLAGTFEVDQNGVKVAGGDATRSLVWQARLSPKPATIRFTLDASRTSRLYPLSTRSRTVWTWRSAADTRARLAAGWVCGSFFPGPPFKVSRDCAAQPLLALGYQMGGLGLTGSVPAGSQRVGITVGHFQPSGSTTKITRISVEVSFDGGKTWHTARVTGTGGSYRAVFTAPAGAKVTLRTSAADAAGSSVTDTIISAYRTGS